MLMIIAALLIVGLCMGSFVNALVWRLHEQAKTAKSKSADKAYIKRLSVSKGRSMCPHCKHELATKDLLPLVSWLSLRGRCRYCHKSIGIQYPIVELSTALLFVVSYIWWPSNFDNGQTVLLALWLAILVGLMALLVYDLRWYILPDRIVYPLGFLAAAYAVITIAVAHQPAMAALNEFLAVAVGGGLFYILFQVSDGKWIGGGDVKLGWVLGLVLATPGRAILMIFLASLLGSLASLPLLASKKLKKDSAIPFGPFLIVAAIIVQLFGHAILLWYQRSVVGINV